MSKRESAEAAATRWQLLAELQEHYREFVPFLTDAMAFLGFSTSEIQEDVALWIAHGPALLMVQAQRGQAKTTVAALYAIWCLIHHPYLRVLIVSAGGTQANEISTLIVRVIESWDILECMRPDANAGDRSSVEHFDVHYTLKGIDKSPSVACVGIGSNLQGKRADLLIADDVESSKNAATALQRAQLTHLTLDFESICTGCERYPARTIWLGTPQSVDSIYNGLPGRGVAIRIWPGRYPTAAQMENYGDHLAPLILSRIQQDPSLQTGGGVLGTEGRPLDPSFIGEEKLQRKWRAQGEAYFQLQHMLNTRLTDAMRYPLRTDRLVALRLNESRLVPVRVVPGQLAQHLRAVSYADWTFKVNTPAETGGGYEKVPTLAMYIDPAAGGLNADETGYAVGAALHGNVYLFDIGGIPGGYTLDRLMRLAEIARKWEVEIVRIEKNLGFGAFREVFTPVLRKVWASCSIEDDMVHGQKELRIAATLEPVIGRGSLIVNEAILESDWATASVHPMQSQKTYSFFYQLSKLTRDRNALIHDDRLDAVEGLVRIFQAQLGTDQDSASKAAEQAAYKLLTRDPLGYNRYRRPTSRLANARLRR